LRHGFQHGASNTARSASSEPQISAIRARAGQLRLIELDPAHALSEIAKTFPASPPRQALERAQAEQPALIARISARQIM
jgi:hypothetical protein